jgi:hypothetical protein
MLVFAADQRYSLYQAISEAVVDHATKTCTYPGCTRRTTSPSFTATVAQELAPPAQQWPPKFASVHRLQNVLENLHRCGVIEVAGLQYGCRHTSAGHSVSLHHIASECSARVKGLCLLCAKQGASEDSCEHEHIGDSVAAFDKPE